MKKIISLIICLVPLVSFGIVDTRSAGYSKTFSDFKASQSANYPLEIKRTYNSRSIYNGLFGFGWCSNFETSLTVLPDGSIKVVECGGGMEIMYHPKGKSPDVASYVQLILTKIKERKVKMSQKSLKKLEQDLLNSKNLRANFLTALDIKGEAFKNLTYYAKGRAKETIRFTNAGYVRKLPNGFKELFNKEGRLISSFYKDEKIEIKWGAKQITAMDERGNRLVLQLNKNGKVVKASFNKKVVARYTHKGNLVKVVNSSGETFTHEYDKLQNLTKTRYPDGKTEVLTYNPKKDWVIGFKDKAGCQESYDYGVNSKNPNHYFSTVQKVCGRRIVNKSKYEFWHKTKPGGGKYLYRARAKVNGRIQTDVVYHPVFETPVSFYKNGVRTTRRYYKNGFLKEKDNKFQNVKYEQYNQQCRKPEKIQVSYKNPNKTIRKTETTRFQFNKDCHLLMAKKSDDEWIKISYTSDNRIKCMEDQSRKTICLSWHKTLNKPEVITRKGVGSLKIVYDKQGSVVELKGLKRGPTIVTQVTSVFNSFLSTLGPVAEEMMIL